jgi:hypothetical protein
MNHSDLTRAMTAKFSRYTLAQCDYAIADINRTLTLYAAAYGSEDVSDPYVVKLYAELDAARDRRMILSGRNLRQRRAIASAHALIASL